MNNLKFTCYCGSEETSEHIYNCEILSDKKDKKLNFERIYNGTIREQDEIFRTFEQNMKTSWG